MNWKYIKKLLPPMTPEGVRQTKEGYWVGALPRKGTLEFFTNNRITLVLSAVQTSEEIRQGFEEAGIRQVNIPMGMTFRHAQKILEVREPPEQCYIHCYHGADRTGCILSFLLCLRHGWTIPDAFYSVVYCSKREVSALGELLTQIGYEDRRSLEDPSVGFYSYAACGLIGGMKAFDEGYQTLILSTIEAIRKYHAE